MQTNTFPTHDTIQTNTFPAHDTIHLQYRMIQYKILQYMLTLSPLMIQYRMIQYRILNGSLTLFSLALSLIRFQCSVFIIQCRKKLSPILLLGSLIYFPFSLYHHTFDVYLVLISLIIITFISRSMIGLQPFFLYFNYLSLPFI